MAEMASAIGEPSEAVIKKNKQASDDLLLLHVFHRLIS
jgi:hypothetical protein